MDQQPVCYETWNYSDVTTANESLIRLQWSGMDKVLITVIIPIVVIVGVLGNLAFLFTVARIHRMQIVTNYYLVNLSIADILFMLITCGSYLRTYLNSPIRNNMPFTSEHGCWGNAYPIYLSYYLSVLLVTLVSLERFFTICMPVKHRLIQGKKRTIKLIVVCWVLSLVLAALTTPRYGRLKQKCFIWPETEDFNNFPTTYRSCYFVNEALAVACEVIQTVIFLVALVVSGVTYYKLIQVLSSSTSLAWSRRGRRQSVRDKQIRNQVARLLIINGVVFFLCQFPARIINIDKVIRAINGNLQDHFATLFAIANGLLLLNSAVNPFIYGLSSQFYRIAFCQAFGIASYFNMERSFSLGGSSYMSQSKESSVHSSIKMNENTITANVNPEGIPVK